MKKENKKRASVTLDPQIRHLCKLKNINISNECNNFLKALFDIESYDEAALEIEITKTSQEIYNNKKKLIILENELGEKKLKRLEDKNKKENSIIWNKLLSEYRTKLDINSSNLEEAMEKLNLTENEIYEELERILGYS